MGIEIPEIEKISEGKNRGGEGVGSAIHRRRANKGSINVKETERERV